jgi:hypothetical protein
MKTTLILIMRAALAQVGVIAAATAALSSPARAQAAPVKMSVTVAGKTQELRGTGRCGHEPQASIYGTRAALWLIEYHNAESRISLSYWRPKATGAEDQFQLSVTRGSGSHVISTVKRGSPTGSGRSTFRPTATGGRFEVSGKAGDGAPLQVTIECARFGGITAEGG